MSSPAPASSPFSGFFRGRNEVRWGMIGCGDVAEVKSGPGFRLASGSKLVAVMRRDAAKAADYARRHGVPRWYADADQLIADPAVDAIYIATPPDTHLTYALKVAAAGKPAYVEKPMARNTTECDAMVRTFAEKKLPLYVAYYRRRLPRFLLVKELLASGAIGTVTSVRYDQSEPFHRKDAGWRVDVAAAGAGHFLDVGAHTIDLMDELFGPLRNVSGCAANRASSYSVEDSVALSFTTAAGIVGAATWNFASHVHTDTFRISGTDGELQFSVFDNAPVQLETSRGRERMERAHPPHVHQPLIQSMVDELLGRGDVCPSTGVSGQRASAVMDVALNAFYGGRQDAFWTREATWPGRRQR